MGQKKMVTKSVKLPQDLVDWWDNQENASHEARKAIRFYMKYQNWMEQRFLQSGAEEPRPQQDVAAESVEFNEEVAFEEKEQKVDVWDLEGKLDQL